MTIYLENGNGVVGHREYKTLIESKDCRVCQYAVNIDKCTVAFCDFKPSAPVTKSLGEMQNLYHAILKLELSESDYEKFYSYWDLDFIGNYIDMEFLKKVANLLRDKYNFDVKREI
jgi:arginyl-tRNA--protein-N-Asp/Glu arginylyltransferase